MAQIMSELDHAVSDPNIAKGYSKPANQKGFLKLNVKHIVDTECVIAGVLLVSPYCITFRPAVVHLVGNCREKYKMVAFMDVVKSIALHKQLKDWNVAYCDEDEDFGGSDMNAQHSHSEIYRGMVNRLTPFRDGMLSHCLCIRVLSSEACRAKEFIHCNCLQLPDSEFGDKFWFSIPQWTVDILYNFFVEWLPEKYANYEAGEEFSDDIGSNVHANRKNLSQIEHVSSSIDSPQLVKSLNCKQKADRMREEKQYDTKLKLVAFEKNMEYLYAKSRHALKNKNPEEAKRLRDLLEDYENIHDDMVEFYHEQSKESIREVKRHDNCSRSRCCLHDLPDIVPVATEKSELMRERKNKKIVKLTDGIVKAEDVAGFRGRKSIDNILEFIEGGSSKTNKNSPIKKNEKNKKKDTKKCEKVNNFSDINVESSTKIKNESAFSVDEFESYNGEISKNINSFSTKHDFYDSENSEHEEYLTDFIPVSRNRLPKFKSYNANETKAVICGNFEKPVSSRKSENEERKSKKNKKFRINPLRLKLANYKVDESGSGKVATLETINVANSSNFSLNEILNKKQHKNDKISTPNESLSNGPVSTAAKNIPVSRNRFPKFKSCNANETKPVIVPKNNFEKPASSRKSENEERISKKPKKFRFFEKLQKILNSENNKVEGSESGKVAAVATVNVTNSSNFSDEILNKKKHKNEKISTPKPKSLSNGPVSTAAKNKAPFELTPLSDHCQVLSFRYFDDICEYKKIAREVDMMCNNPEN